MSLGMSESIEQAGCQADRPPFSEVVCGYEAPTCQGHDIIIDERGERQKIGWNWEEICPQRARKGLAKKNPDESLIYAGVSST